MHLASLVQSRKKTDKCTRYQDVEPNMVTPFSIDEQAVAKHYTCSLIHGKAELLATTSGSLLPVRVTGICMSQMDDRLRQAGLFP